MCGLEEESGYYLFDRIGKQILLNENVKIFYRYAKYIVSEYENMRTSLSELNHKKVYGLYVGVCASSQLLPALLQQFRRRMNENEQIQVKASYPLDFIKDNMDLMIDSDSEKGNREGIFVKRKHTVSFSKRTSFRKQVEDPAGGHIKISVRTAG